MQESWENMTSHSRFQELHEAIEAGLENIRKWYRKVDDTDAYFICLSACYWTTACRHLDAGSFVVLDPNIKLAYAEAKWDPEYYLDGVRRLKKAVCVPILAHLPSLMAVSIV